MQRGIRQEQITPTNCVSREYEEWKAEHEKIVDRASQKESGDFLPQWSQEALLHEVKADYIPRQCLYFGQVAEKKWWIFSPVPVKGCMALALVNAVKVGDKDRAQQIIAEMKRVKDEGSGGGVPDGCPARDFFKKDPTLDVLEARTQFEEL